MYHQSVLKLEVKLCQEGETEKNLKREKCRLAKQAEEAAQRVAPEFANSLKKAKSTKTSK